eukprot:scaffold204669_cov46-Tisochrysis_lutea.AAC.1
MPCCQVVIARSIQHVARVTWWFRCSLYKLVVHIVMRYALCVLRVIHKLQVVHGRMDGYGLLVTPIHAHATLPHCETGVERRQFVSQARQRQHMLQLATFHLLGIQALRMAMPES